MKLEWKNDEEIGHYNCIVTDDDGYIEDIWISDYTCEYQSNRKAKDKAYNRYHPEAFEAGYCNGYSMHKTFDGSHTLEDVKRWCEDYLLDKYINYYNKIVADFEKIKSQAEWASRFKNERLDNK